MKPCVRVSGRSFEIRLNQKSVVRMKEVLGTFSTSQKVADDSGSPTFFTVRVWVLLQGQNRFVSCKMDTMGV